MLRGVEQFYLIITFKSFLLKQVAIIIEFISVYLEIDGYDTRV